MSHDTKAQTTAICSILHGTWDPVGCGVLEDEYDSYIWPIYVLMIRGADWDEVERYPRWAADEQVQSPVPQGRLAVVLGMLNAIGVEPGPADPPKA